MPSHAPHLPLAAHEVICVRSLDEYTAWCDRRGVRQAIWPRDGGGGSGPQPFEVRIARHAFAGGALEVAAGGPSGVHVQGAPSEGQYQLLVPTGGHGRLKLGAKAIDLAGGSHGSLIGPRSEHSLALSAGWADLSVYVDVTHLSSVLRAWTGDDGGRPPVFRPSVSLAGEDTQRLRTLTALLLREVEDEASGTRIAEVFERWCLALLRTQPGDHQSTLNADAPLASQRHVRVAEAYMEAHHARALRMAEVAREAGVGLRALQKAFLKHRDSSPVRALRTLRLEGARARLSLEPEHSVREAAQRSGLTHLGRFSVAYRRAFGESPSETRRRAHAQPLWAWAPTGPASDRTPTTT
jgi:AraC-like DNA-binding protein